MAEIGLSEPVQLFLTEALAVIHKKLLAVVAVDLLARRQNANRLYHLQSRVLLESVRTCTVDRDVDLEKNRAHNTKTLRQINAEILTVPVKVGNRPRVLSPGVDERGTNATECGWHETIHQYPTICEIRLRVP